VLYVATGDSYTDAPNTGSDAVVAMDLTTGAIRWNRQITEHDNYVVGCTGAKGQPAACPQVLGPDHDFGASPILRVLPNGQSVLIAGQKSSAVTALDPNHGGAMLWQVKLGNGGPLGGIEWGMAADRSLVFAPVTDLFAPAGTGKPGLYALRIADGHRVWSIAPPDPDCKTAPKGSLVNVCTSGFSGAATAIDGLVIEGSMDGKLRAHNVRDGKIVWEADLGQTSFQPINAAAPRKGDTMNGAGASVAGGMLFQISGYQSSYSKAMNLLLAFTVDGK
jgi:polyvinyl alcohol dehydrogenase (cytochrome)